MLLHLSNISSHSHLDTKKIGRGTMKKDPLTQSHQDTIILTTLKRRTQKADSCTTSHPLIKGDGVNHAQESQIRWGILTFLHKEIPSMITTRMETISNLQDHLVGSDLPKVIVNKRGAMRVSLTRDPVISLMAMNLSTQTHLEETISSKILSPQTTDLL
jgi:hypothetical protein